MFAVEGHNHQTSKAKSFGRDGFCCSWFNPNSHHAVMITNSQEITRVGVRAKCICAIMRCKMESELEYNAFNPLPDLFFCESSTHEILYSHRGIVHTMRFLAATTTRAVSADAQCGLRHHHLQHGGTLAVLLSHV